MARHNAEWVTIPVAPKYEMNLRGDVRNKTTGNLVKIQRLKDNNVRVYLSTNGKRKIYSVSNLLWLTHGAVEKNSTLSLPVVISKGNERHYFDSIRKATQFIACREFFSSSWTRELFTRRNKEIFGWRINYQR